MSENTRIEATLWKTADKLRNNMDAAEYKLVVGSLIKENLKSTGYEI